MNFCPTGPTLHVKSTAAGGETVTTSPRSTAISELVPCVLVDLVKNYRDLMKRASFFDTAVMSHTNTQAALARYHRKRKRRPFVKAMRENDPNRKEQNKARERPRDGGKFRKKGKDFVSVKELQRAGDNRSVSNELPPPPARDSTPPPSKIRSLNGRPSQEGDAAGPPVGGGDSGGSLYLLTPDQAAKLGLKERDNR